MTATLKLDPACHVWMRTPEVGAVLEALRAGGAEGRFVGGCVRDALMGHKVKDIDIAVNAPPDRVERMLQAQGLAVVRTGFAHGTVTAVVNGRGFELTSLRRDMATDGRHAIVAYTDAWHEDAGRRDFTVNALYADLHGTVYDYVGGAADVQAGMIRFIGDPRARIEEDVLRILRFFRFTAWYAKSAPHAESLAACRDFAHLMPRLSVERVWQEMKKLLAAPDPVPVAGLMLEQGILRDLLPEARQTARLAAMLGLQKNMRQTDALQRFAAFIDGDEPTAQAIARRWKLSRRESERLAAMMRTAKADAGNPRAVRRLAYREGPAQVADRLMMQGAGGEDVLAALAIVRDWTVPHFPVSGEDVLACGLTAGTQVGEILRQVEDWWIGEDFQPDRAACLARVRQIVGG